ncbi:MAG: ABC transporter substrate-binding protein [Schleiferiaceae bacterium]
MKKFLGLIAASIIAALPAYAGKLVINANTSDPAPKQAFEKLVADFEKENPDVDVELNIFDHEAYKTAIRNFLQADPPDVVTWFAGNRMKFFVDQGLFEDVSDVWQQNNLFNDMASTASALNVGGQQYGVPYAYYQWGVYYRKDLFAEYGLGEPRTWADFMNICATLKQNGVTPVTIGTKYLWTAAGWFDFLNLRVNGMDFHMELMDGKASYEDPRLDRVFEIWGEMANQGYFLENHATFSWQEAQAPMINGEAAMYLIGNFIVPSLKDAGVVDKVGYFQFPVINADVRTFEEAPTDTVHIPSGAKNKADAKRFLAFVARADINNQVATSIGNLPPNSKAPAPTDPFLKIGFKVLSESAGLAQFYDRDTTPEMAKEGMKGFQEFMVKPEREKQIRGRIEKARQRIFK